MVTYISDRSEETVKRALILQINRYKSKNLIITTILVDGEGAMIPLRINLESLKINVSTTARNKHVPEIGVGQQQNIEDHPAKIEEAEIPNQMLNEHGFNLRWHRPNWRDRFVHVALPNLSIDKANKLYGAGAASSVMKKLELLHEKSVWGL